MCIACVERGGKYCKSYHCVIAIPCITAGGGECVGLTRGTIHTNDKVEAQDFIIAKLSLYSVLKQSLISIPSIPYCVHSSPPTVATRDSDIPLL